MVRMKADAVVTEPPSTRDRILDVALDLFTEQGFDGTSLRELADRLGFTKAALYYHFRSKEDILLALHRRVHDVGRAGLARLADGHVDLSSWAELLDDVLGEMFAQRQLFLMHQRNQAALERLHAEDHEADHEDLLDRLQKVLGDKAIPVRDRVRMACSFGALFGVLFVSGESFSGVGDEDLKAMLRDAIQDLLFQ